MIDTDKYEGAEEVYLCEELHKGWTDVISKETNQPIARIYCADTVRSHSPTPAHHILMDAFKLYREVKRLRGLLDTIVDITLKELKIFDDNCPMINIRDLAYKGILWEE